VTFADDKVVDLLNAKFVLLWNNHQPDLGGGDARQQPAFTKEELELYPEGGGGGNVRTYFCLSDGRIVHYVEGWFRPERFLEEAEFALTLRQEGLAERHNEHRKHHLDAQAEVARAHPDEMRRPHAQSAERRRHAMLGLQARAHELAQGLVYQPVRQVLDSIREHARGRVFK